MPRKLPWGSSKPPPPPPPPQQSPPTKRRRTSPPPEKDEDEATGEIYMRPEDERYIMVEDEFLSIAQTYTRSIHRAEYGRLQLEAKAKNARRICEIQRPVDGVTRMSKETLLKHELAAKQQARERALMDIPLEDEDGSDVAARSVWGRSSLGMLMCSPKKKDRNLSTKWKITSGTRAAAGFKAAAEVGAGRFAKRAVKTVGKAGTAKVDKKAPIKRPQVIEKGVSSTETGDEDDDEDEDEDEDDDLDAPVVRQGQASQASTISRSQSLSQKPPQPCTHPSIAHPSPTQSSQNLTLSSSQRSVKKEIPDFDFGLDLASQRSAGYRGRSMARKKAERLREDSRVGSQR